MKQTKLILALPVIGLLSVIVPIEGVHNLITYVQLELYVICLCGCIAMKRAMWFLLCVWATWNLVTSQVLFAQEIAQLEAGAFMALFWWVLRRPDTIPSDPRSDTVQIAFYSGSKSPLIAHLAALIGLPVTGIAVVIGDYAIVPVGKSGKLRKCPREALRGWIKLDTGKYFPLDEFYRMDERDLPPAGCMCAFNNVLTKVVRDLSAVDTPSSLLTKLLANRS